MTPEETRNEKLSKEIIKSLNERHFDAYYCKTKKEAKEKVLSLIGKNDTVAYGGSQTLDCLGVKEVLRENGQNLIDRDKATSPDERKALMKKALLADTFLTGTNALTMSGELLNIDGNGNRVAAMTYGPESVIVVAGMNKIVKNIDDALSRARNLAAPVNAQRFDIKTPCSKTGMCADCKSEQSICTYIVETRLSHPKGRIKVVLIGENLGF